MNKILNNLLNYRGKKNTFLNLFKDFYFVFMLIFPFTGLYILLAGFEEVFAGLYLYLVYFGVLALYWTPLFQNYLDVDRRLLNLFHNKGGYRYRVLERIGRRLHKQGEPPEKVYSTLLEFSNSDKFEKMDTEKLEEIAIEAKEDNISDINEKLT